MIVVENNHQEPSAQELRYLLAEHRINRVLGVVTARNLQLKTSWKAEDPMLEKNTN